MNINLQLFAETIELSDEDMQEMGLSTEDFETEEQEEVEEVEETEENAKEEDSTEEETNVEIEKVEEQPKDDGKVPRTALIAERKKWQEKLKALERQSSIVERMVKASGKTPEQIQADIDAWQEQQKAQGYIDKGYSEDAAKELAKAEQQRNETQRLLNEYKYKAEIAELKSNPLYANIDNHKDEVIAMAEKTGLTAKQAYNAMFGDTMFSDYKTQIEQSVIANSKKKQAAKIDTSTSAVKQMKINLSRDELNMAKEMGVTPKEFIELKNN